MIKDLPQRLVFVDHEQDLREIVRATIEDAGYEGALATCGSGEELLSRIRILQPELILLDLQMPGMDGPDVMAALYKNADAKGIPIVLCTGSHKLEMLELYKPLGVVGVIHKPLDLENLVSNIAALWLAYCEDYGQLEA